MEVDTFKIVIIHQLLFQGMFVAKNIYLSRKLGVKIRGNNPESILATVFFALIIITTLIMSNFNITFGEFSIMSDGLALAIGLGGIISSTFVSGASLVGLKNSWRVGIIEEQQTELVTSGIYKYTRNPYFLSYLLMFLSYAILLQNTILLACFMVALSLVHKMILNEEKYLYSVHGDLFLIYKKATPRYLVV